MAATAAGTQLTRDFRNSQVILRGALIRDLLILWSLFDPKAPSSYDEFMRLAEVLIRQLYRDSAGLAMAYYRDFLAAEGVRSLVVPRDPLPLEQERIRIALVATGLEGTLRAMRLRYPIGQAKDNGFVLASGAATRLGLEGGRSVIRETVQADGLVTGWIRVTSAKACAFCAMLASRGPVYKESTVGFQAHDHCSCSPEPYHSGSAWPERNQQFRDQWNEFTAGKGGMDALNAFRAHLEGRPAD